MSLRSSISRTISLHSVVLPSKPSVSTYLHLERRSRHNSHKNLYSCILSLRVQKFINPAKCNTIHVATDILAPFSLFLQSQSLMHDTFPRNHFFSHHPPHNLYWQAYIPNSREPKEYRRNGASIDADRDPHWWTLSLSFSCAPILIIIILLGRIQIHLHDFPLISHHHRC